MASPDNYAHKVVLSNDIGQWILIQNTSYYLHMWIKQAVSWGTGTTTLYCISLPFCLEPSKYQETVHHDFDPWFWIYKFYTKNQNCQKYRLYSIQGFNTISLCTNKKNYGMV
jgi:hypothetical protein